MPSMNVCSVHTPLIVSQVASNAPTTPIDLLSCFSLQFWNFSSMKNCNRYILCHCLLLYTICAIELQATIGDSGRNFICLSLPPENLIRKAGKQTLTERFFSGWHVKLLFVITLFYFLSHSQSHFFHSLLHHLLFIRVVPIVAQQSQWIYSWDVLCIPLRAKIKSSSTACVFVCAIFKWHKCMHRATHTHTLTK